MKQDVPHLQHENGRRANRKWYSLYLLLVVVLIALILFFNWFTNYFS